MTSPPPDRAHEPQPKPVDPVDESQRLRVQLYAAVEQLEHFAGELRAFVRTAHDDQTGDPS